MNKEEKRKAHEKITGTINEMVTPQVQRLYEAFGGAIEVTTIVWEAGAELKEGEDAPVVIASISTVTIEEIVAAVQLIKARATKGDLLDKEGVATDGDMEMTHQSAQKIAKGSRKVIGRDGRIVPLS